jgi:DNA-binding MarR family transcriptional regulator
MSFNVENVDRTSSTVPHPFSRTAMSTPQDAAFDQTASAVHNRLFFRLFQAGNTLDRQSIKELGITTVQWATLGALSRPKVETGMSFSDLADYLVVSRQSLDGLLKRLEREGHVQRVVDPADRRAKKVVLLPAGRTFWNGIQPQIYEFYRQAVATFRFDDKVALLHYINRLNQGMSKVDLSVPTEPERKSAGYSSRGSLAGKETAL